jgi:signal transduction histidine kinase
VGDALIGFAKLTHELREAKSRLDQEQSERSELSRRLQEADKLVTIGQLSASLAQEIDSPLGVLEGRARDLFDHAKEPESIRSGGTLVEQAGRIRRIVGRLATLSRRPLRAHRGISATEAVSVVLELLNAECVRRDVRIQVETERDLPDVLADPDQLEQVVLNLVRNALQATPDGGTVSVRLVASELQQGAEETRLAIELSVIDNGHGMNAATRERAFEPFFTTRADVGATGLGLSVVKSMVDQHRGSVQISSELGSGTTVKVKLPAMVAAERGLEPAPPESTRSVPPPSR